MATRNKMCIDLLGFKKRNPLVFWLVALYLIFLLIYSFIYLSFYADHDKAMALNELGDFLAGSFSPLAFLFLYLGYKQQGQELKQNTKALNMQAVELKNSVEQQTKLVETAKKDLEITINKITKDNQFQLIQAQPFFHIYDLRVSVIYSSNSMSSEAEFVFIFDFKNSRTMCRSLFFTLSLEESSPSYLLDGSSFDIVQANIDGNSRVNAHTQYKISNVKALPLVVFLHFNYTDAYDEIQSQTIKIELGENANTNPYDHIYQWFKKSFTS